MLELLVYDLETRMRPHITVAGSKVCEDDIESRYGCVPAKRESIDSFCLDPGGFAFSDTEPISFEVKGIPVTVRPEHLYAMDDIGSRLLTDTEWTKIYLEHMCVVIPTPVWAEVLIVAKTLASVHEDGRDLLAERLKGIPHVRVKE